MKIKNAYLVLLSIILVIIMMADFHFKDEVKKKVGRISINHNYNLD
ncbi:hypothetical protein [Oceanirhabdus seepicola]|uniref:Uncharacterized protein n=1 Tax=Oceanirhabdus seepicola TaxID=2828781 RepID=A0A9J6NWZ7_9CLOT|nr:hypothetical protein [Oceanirhabdus seepicola]MCM1988425.1 hypothetical protein [Oceanirhabdus seepicola]